MKQKSKLSKEQKPGTKEHDNTHENLCETCPMFNSLNDQIGVYHKLILDKRSQMVRDLTSSVNINLN